MPSYCFDSGDMVNKRIDELFGQALDAAVPETWTTLNPVQLMRLRDKFAELIVKECVKIANDEATAQISAKGKVAADNIWFTIRNRFGVE